MRSWYAIYLYLFAVSAILSVVIVPVFRRLARRFGYMSTPHPEKHGSTPIPLLGGGAIFFVFNVVVLGHFLVALLISRTGFLGELLPSQVVAYMPGVLRSASKLVPLLCGGLIIFVLGLIDDRQALSPVLKILGQILAAVVLVLGGIRLTFFIPSAFLASLLTIFWVVLIVNAFNFLDNMDGLSGGVAFIASVFFLLAAVQVKMFFVSTALSVFAGAVIGFLIYNFNPAAIYMGDAGSMFIGFILAALTVESTFYRHDASPTYFPILMPIIILAIPLYEMAMVTTVRVRKGLSIFKPSKDHLSYRLASVGLSTRGAVLFIYFLTICIGIAALLLPQTDYLGSVLVLIQVIVILSIVAILIHYGKNGDGRK